MTTVNGGWHEGELAVQRRAGVTNHERLRGGVRDALPPHFVAFLSVQRFIVMAHFDAEGHLWSTMVAGWPGFAIAPEPERVTIDRRAVDDDLARQLEADGRVGLLAFDPSTRRRIRINGVVTVGNDFVQLQIVETFGNCQQYIQKRPAEGPEAAESVTVARGDRLAAEHKAWIAKADTCFLASAHPVAGPDASHRGGRPGFITVVDDRTLEFADYPGNDMFQTLGNITANPAAAMLFVDFESGATLQLSGEAQVVWDENESLTGRLVRFTARDVVEKAPRARWSWPVVEYSPVNP